jgi:hypothetical protein
MNAGFARPRLPQKSAAFELSGEEINKYHQHHPPPATATQAAPAQLGIVKSKFNGVKC